MLSYFFWLIYYFILMNEFHPYFVDISIYYIDFILPIKRNMYISNYWVDIVKKNDENKIIIKNIMKIKNIYTIYINFYI